MTETWTNDWYDDPRYLAGFARWLSHRCLLAGAEDTHMFYEDPRAWIEARLAGDLREEYEAEKQLIISTLCFTAAAEYEAEGETTP